MARLSSTGREQRAGGPSARGEARLAGIPEREWQGSAEEILRLACEKFAPDIAVTSSFQTQSLPLLHMVSQIRPETPVLFVDTGFHFPTTLAFRDQVVGRLGLDLRVLRPAPVRAELGAQPYKRDPDLCCFRNKVEPFLEARRGLAAWVSGIRRVQTAARGDTPVAERLEDGVYKICPLVAWSDADVDSYISQHGLPRHPLDARGYASIGCEPCTRRVRAGDDPRSGRWAGLEKTECGLHQAPREGEDE